MTRALSLATLVFVTTAGPALAQSEKDNVIYKDVTELDMSELNIEATVVKPPIGVVNETRRPRFNPMIKLRKDFDVEVDQSIQMVR